MLAKMFSKFELNKVWEKVRQMSLDNLQASKTFFFPSDVKEVWKEWGSALGRTPFTTTTTLRRGRANERGNGVERAKRPAGMPLAMHYPPLLSQEVSLSNCSTAFAFLFGKVHRQNSETNKFIFRTMPRNTTHNFA